MSNFYQLSMQLKNKIFCHLQREWHEAKSNLKQGDSCLRELFEELYAEIDATEQEE